MFVTPVADILTSPPPSNPVVSLASSLPCACLQVEHVKPHVLFGLSGTPGRFTPQVSYLHTSQDILSVGDTPLR